MLPKKQRVSKEFFKKLEKTRTFSGEFLIMKVKAEKGLARISFVVSKKIAKSAVERNRLRRMGYAAAELLISKITPGYIFIFYFRKQNKKVSVESLRNEIKNLLKNSQKISN